MFVQPFDEGIVTKISNFIDKDVPFSYSFVIDGPDSMLGKLSVQNDLMQETNPQIVTEETQKGSIRKFITTVQSAPALIIVGGVHITIKLAQIAKIMGYKIYVVDPRKAFMTGERFPEIGQLITSWPENCALSI